MDAYLRFLRSKLGHALIKAPAAGIVARDDQGRIMLVRRRDDGTWGIVGGWMSPGEGALEAAKRECQEESGYEVEVTGLLGVYSDPEHMRWTYPNGDQAEFVSVVFEAHVKKQVSSLDGEALEIRFFTADELPEIRLNDRQMVQDAISSLPRPFIR
jgi:ADP-ribose pyrophosphatase YjhB (NUDIX family)